MKENFAELLNAPEANKRFDVPLYFAAGETDIALNNSFKTMGRRWARLGQLATLHLGVGPNHVRWQQGD